MRSLFLLVILGFVCVPFLALAQSYPLDSEIDSFYQDLQGCDEREVSYTKDGKKMLLPCRSHQPCAPIVILHKNEGVTAWEVYESDFQEGDHYACIPAPEVGCDPKEGCECVPFGRNYNNGNPTRFCRCLKKIE